MIKKVVAVFWLVFLLSSVKGQDKSNPISTAVPFLTISPDARSGGMGDGGVAFSNDANTLFWNPARMAFFTDDINASISYSPWFNQTIKGSYLGYGAFVKKIDDRNTLGFSIRQLKLGEIDLYDENVNALGQFRPSELSVDISGARKFGSFSLGLTVRYIHSDLSNGLTVQGVPTKSVNAIASDVSFSYNNSTSSNTHFSFGADISNIGPKVSYYTSGQTYFLPANLRLGPAWTFDSGKFQTTLSLDINKMLVPTPPLRDLNGNIIKGADVNRSAVSGIFASFADAPGGFGEELKEFYGSGGVETLFEKRFALRCGYFYENHDKGNRKYVTAGIGVLLERIDVNISYIAGSQADSPFANTLRYSVIFHIDKNNQ